MGLLDDIETLDGKVIDGRRRLRACEIAGVTPRFKAIRTDDPVTYVMEKQNRRDLTASQRAMIGARAAALREKIASEAKERQKRKPANSVVEPVPQQTTDATKTRDQIGKLVGVTGRTIQHAVKVIEKGVPELVKAVEEDRIAVSRAAAPSHPSSRLRFGVFSSTAYPVAAGAPPRRVSGHYSLGLPGRSARPRAISATSPARTAAVMPNSTAQHGSSARPRSPSARKPSSPKPSTPAPIASANAWLR